MVVSQFHIKGPGWTTALSVDTIGVLLGLEHLLPHGVEDCVLVLSLKPNHSFEYFHLLFYDQLIHLCQVPKTRWSPSHIRT